MQGFKPAALTALLAILGLVLYDVIARRPGPVRQGDLNQIATNLRTEGFSNLMLQAERETQFVAIAILSASNAAIKIVNKP